MNLRSLKTKKENEVFSNKNLKAFTRTPHQNGSGQAQESREATSQQNKLSRFLVSGRSPISHGTGQSPVSHGTGQSPVSHGTGQSPVSHGTGFTIIEMIMYVALIGVVMVSFIYFAIAITKSRTKNYVVEEVNANARVALEIILNKTKHATDVLSPLPGNSAVALTLDMPSPSPDITFSIIGGILHITENAANIPITSDEVIVSNLNFSNLAHLGERDNIRLNFKVESNNTDPNSVNAHVQNIQSSVSLRR